MKLDKYKAVMQKGSPEVKAEVIKAMDILERIHELLDEKFDGKQKLLAQKLNVSEAVVSKWLNGIQNFSMSTITKLEVAFGQPIIAICTNHNNAGFAQVKVPYAKQNTVIHVSASGKISEEEVTTYTTAKMGTETKTSNTTLV